MPRIMTYNVHRCIGADDRADPRRIAEVIAGCKPDIEANTGTMQEFLDQFSKTLPEDEVAVMYADQAVWHGPGAAHPRQT